MRKLIFVLLCLTICFVVYEAICQIYFDPSSAENISGPHEDWQDASYVCNDTWDVDNLTFGDINTPDFYIEFDAGNYGPYEY